MPCLFCDGTDGPVVFREGPRVARACLRCGLAFVEPTPPPEDRLEVLADQHDPSFYDGPAPYRAEWLAALAQGTLLEVGCGAGVQLQAFAAAGFQVEGVEAMPDRAAAAVARVAAPVRAAFFESLAPEPRFDVVYHTDLLSHFEDPVAMLRRMSAWLRPGGLLAFEVGALTGPPHTWARWNDNPALRVHRWLYTDAGLANLMRAAGLQVVDRRDHDLGPYVTWLKALQRARRLVRRGGRGVPIAEGQRADAGPPGPLRRLSHRVADTLRYRVGRHWPGAATRTVLMAARPRG